MLFHVEMSGNQPCVGLLCSTQWAIHHLKYRKDAVTNLSIVKQNQIIDVATYN